MRLSTGLRDVLADAIDTDVGATGFARFYTASGTTLLASAACSNPAFGAAATGVITLDVTPAVEDTTPAAAGTCIRLGFYSAATGAYATDVFMLGVATGGSPDVTMSNNVIATTDTVQVASLTITVPAGVPDDA
ncbi:MAG: hypothetical protein V3V74_06855 [Nitrosomonadaceae bacterium]